MRYRTYINHLPYSIAENEAEGGGWHATSETFGTAEFSFYRPLRKLKLEIPESRMLEIDVKTAKAKGGDTVFKLEMNLAGNKPRNLAEEEEGAGTNIVRLHIQAPCRPTGATRGLCVADHAGYSSSCVEMTAQSTDAVNGGQS